MRQYNEDYRTYFPQNIKELDILVTELSLNCFEGVDI